MGRGQQRQERLAALVQVGGRQQGPGEGAWSAEGEEGRYWPWVKAKNATRTQLSFRLEAPGHEREAGKPGRERTRRGRRKCRSIPSISASRVWELASVASSVAIASPSSMCTCLLGPPNRVSVLSTCAPRLRAVPSTSWPSRRPYRLACSLTPTRAPPSPCSADAALALEAALSPGEAADFPVLWRGDWRQYAHVYMTEIVRRHMGGKRK